MTFIKTDRAPKFFFFFKLDFEKLDFQKRGISLFSLRRRAKAHFVHEISYEFIISNIEYTKW